MFSDDLPFLPDKLLQGDIRSLSRGITLVESLHPVHRRKAGMLVDQMLPFSGKSIRVGITGVPGVGKSTFIEALGLYLVELGHKVAVLTVDPSSQRSKGSILGDKTRMVRLAGEKNAFIRPSPSGSQLGGVAAKTRESIILCEAAGFEVIIVETVGVGQSETEVASMVDFFLLLMLPGAGDELQGIKKGIIELADAIAVNKADGDNLEKAENAKKDYENAIHYLPPESGSWEPVVTLCSSLEKRGIDTIWDIILLYRKKMEQTGEMEKKRKKQSIDWMWQLIENKLKDEFLKKPAIKKELNEIFADIEEGKITPTSALERLF